MKKKDKRKTKSTICELDKKNVKVSGTIMLYYMSTAYDLQNRCQEYSMKYIYSTSQMSKLSLTLCTFSVTVSVAGLFLTSSFFCPSAYSLYHTT